MLTSNIAQASGLQAQVTKSDAVATASTSTKYPMIATFIEYNHYADAEKKTLTILMH